MRVDETNSNYCRYTAISNELGPRVVPEIPVKIHEKYSVYGINGGIVGTIEYFPPSSRYSFTPNYTRTFCLCEKTLRFIADKLAILNGNGS